MKYMASLIRGLVCIGLCTSLLGCPGPLNVPSAWVDSFTRNGADSNQVRLALLECGASVPGDISEYLTPDGKRFPPAFNAHEYLWVGKCMKNSGFPYNDVRPCAGGMDMNGNLIIPAPCKPDAEIPKRSIETRLNSPYCKAYPKATYCQRDYMPSLVEHSKSQEPNKPQDPKPISIAPSTDPATKLQNRIQKDSNAQMNQLLQGPGSRR